MMRLQRQRAILAGVAAGAAAILVWLAVGGHAVTAQAAGAAKARKARPAARTLSARDISLDVSPAAQVLAIWARGDRSPGTARTVASGPAYRILQANLAQQTGCSTTLAELERALANPDSGACGFGLHPAWEARASLDSLVRAIRADSAGIAKRVAARAGAYLPGAPPRPVRYHFLLASQNTFDALTIDGPPGARTPGGASGAAKTDLPARTHARAGADSVPVVIVNLVDVLSYAGDTGGRMASLEHILAHEGFHAVLHQLRRSMPGWQPYGRKDLTAMKHVAEVMLDEGVAHYVDWKDRPGSDTLFTARPGSRERFAFSQLALACKQIRESPPGSAQWWETLQLASSGPLWSKYGAVSGMFAAYRIERAAGRDSLVWSVGAGPGEFLRLYGQAAAFDTTLIPLPQDIADVH